MEGRDDLGRFVAGSCANPSGRPKSEHELVRQAQAQGRRCVETLTELLDHDDAKVRLAASTALLSRLR